MHAVVCQIRVSGYSDFYCYILTLFKPTLSWLVLAVFMFLGFLATNLIPETKDRSLEDISNEPQDNFIRGLSKFPHFKIEMQ